MRRLLSGTLGLGIALSAADAAAQGLGPPKPQATAPSPAAARLVAVQALAPADATDVTARSQMGDQVPKPMPPGGNPMGTIPMPTPTPPPPAATGQPAPAQLGMPRPFAPGPSVTEQRNGTALPPGAVCVPPLFGATYPVTGGYQPTAG